MKKYTVHVETSNLYNSFPEVSTLEDAKQYIHNSGVLKGSIFDNATGRASTYKIEDGIGILIRHKASKK